MNSIQKDSSPSDTDRRPGLCLVFGASGYIGSHLVPRLLEEGIPVRASSRNRAVLEARGWPGVELVEADALDPASLDSALAGVELAYYLVHSMGAGKDFGRLDLAAAANFAAAAERAGVDRIVYLGGLVPDDADSEHIVSRRDTGVVLRRGKVPVIELRAGIIVGPGSAAFEVMRDLVYHLPVMITPRWVSSKSPPLALDNLLMYLVRLPQIDAAKGGVFDAGGAETLTYGEMMRVLAEVGGKRPPLIIPVPVLSPKLSSYWLRLITAVPTNIARALIEGLKHDFTADDAELRRLVPQHLLGFREAVAAVFAAERASEPVVARWIEGAFAVRNRRIDYAYYAKRAGGSAETSASPAAVWELVSAIGGDNGYYYMNGLWQLRELLDWMAGGPWSSAWPAPPDRAARRRPHRLLEGAGPGARAALESGLRHEGPRRRPARIRPEAARRRRHKADGHRLLASRWRLGAALLVRIRARAQVHVQPAACARRID
jgi:uncharacterized protein YbjT (DUF2867 family)